MLFNSLIFLLAFAPVTFGVYFALGRLHAGPRAITLWLALTSLLFYAWWLPKHTLILLTSIALNYVVGRWIVRAGPPKSAPARRVLTLAIVLNLAALVYYKYAGFFVSTATTLLGQDWEVPAIVLPLGISFFTFTQLAYLVDTYQGKVRESDFLRYLLFVTYFPHLIAGPVIHHKDVMPQFERADVARWCSANVAAGAAIFMLGLFKKVFIADSLVPYVTPVFDGGGAPQLLHAWGGALAYSFQLYFDFSGYSDMAIGLSLALNVRLPYNFNSPYKALSIADFWKRWHISLSTFLRDYLYIPLGGNRCGPVRRYANLLLTMLIGGMWHGAGWTFIVWGGLHGAYLVINHAWQHVRAQLSAAPAGAAERAAAWLLTFVAVVVAWVFFRAHDFSSAWSVVAGMAGLHGVGGFTLELADAKTLDYLPLFAALAALLVAVVALPNSQQLVARWLLQEPSPRAAGVGGSGAMAWRSPPLWVAIAWGVVAAVGLMHVSQPTQFLYFNF